MSNSGLTYRRRSLTALLTALAMIFTFSLGVLAQNFSDVDENANYNEAVNWLTEIDVFTGYPDGTFRPEDDLSREEFAAVVVRALNKESASDALDNQATD